MCVFTSYQQWAWIQADAPVFHSHPLARLFSGTTAQASLLLWNVSDYVLICWLHLPVCLLIGLRGKPTCLTHYLELSVGNLTTLGSGNWKLAPEGKLKDLPESKLLHTEFMFWYSEKILVNIHYCCKLLNLFTEFFRSTCSCVMLLNLSGESGIVNFTKTRNIWCYYILL